AGDHVDGGGRIGRGAFPGARYHGVEQRVERRRRRVMDDQEDGHRRHPGTPSAGGRMRHSVSICCAAVAVRQKSSGAPAAGADDAWLAELEQYRRPLTGYCYRMLGSAFEADDAVQESIVRAWRAADSFEGRSSVRSWLYRIATNVWLDMLRGRERRARAIDLGACGETHSFT